MTRTILAVAFLLSACVAPPRSGPWLVVDPAPGQQDQADCLVTAAHEVTGDPHGLIDRGGRIGVETQPGALDAVCGELGPGRHTSGCCLDQWVLVLVDGTIYPDLAHSALGHELCHLALKTIDNGQVAACELLVRQRCLP